MNMRKNNERETVIQFDANSKIANIFTSDLKLIKKLLIWIDEDPNIKVVREFDGENDIEIDIPIEYIKIQKPKIVSEKMRAANRKKLEKYGVSQTKNHPKLG